MALRTYKSGKHFSSRRNLVLSPGSPADIGDTLRQAASERTFNGAIAGDEAALTAIARSADDEYETGREEDGSISDYARRILKLIALTRKAVLEGDADQAARHGMATGRLMRELELKVDWEALAISGSKTSDRLAETSAAHNAKLAAESAAIHRTWQKLGEEVWSANPHMGKNAVARIVKAKLKSEKATVATIAGRLKKPPRTV